MTHLIYRGGLSVPGGVVDATHFPREFSGETTIGGGVAGEESWDDKTEPSSLCQLCGAVSPGQDAPLCAACQGVARVELYNHFLPGSKFPGNGWYVFRVVDGRRMNQLGDFKRDEHAAREYAASWNRARAPWIGAP